MATIINNENTKGKFLVRAIDGNGNDAEVYCNTLIEAQIIANFETQNQLKYYGEFQSINGLSRHPKGLGFKGWLKLNNK